MFLTILVSIAPPVIIIIIWFAFKVQAGISDDSDRFASVIPNEKAIFRFELTRCFGCRRYRILAAHKVEASLVQFDQTDLSDVDTPQRQRRHANGNMIFEYTIDETSHQLVVSFSARHADHYMLTMTHNGNDINEAGRPLTVLVQVLADVPHAPSCSITGLGASTCIVNRSTELIVRLHDQYGNRVQHDKRIKSGRDRIDEDTHLAKARADAEKKQKKMMKKKAKHDYSNSINNINKGSNNNSNSNDDGHARMRDDRLIMSDEEIRLLSSPLVHLLDLSLLRLTILDSHGRDISDGHVTYTRGKTGLVRCSYTIARVDHYQLHVLWDGQLLPGCPRTLICREAPSENDSEHKQRGVSEPSKSATRSAIAARHTSVMSSSSSSSSTVAHITATRHHHDGSDSDSDGDNDDPTTDDEEEDSHEDDDDDNNNDNASDADEQTHNVRHRTKNVNVTSKATTGTTVRRR